MGGSMGSVVGEKITRAVERALAERIPLIIVSCSGGARMQEGALSLMQLAKTSAALARLEKPGSPSSPILADPTTGGTTASYAMLGDLNIAEPNALIGFAGPRVIEQTIKQKLPKGFQRSEFLLKHGMLDDVVPRKNLRPTLIRALRLLLNRPAMTRREPDDGGGVPLLPRTPGAVRHQARPRQHPRLARGARRSRTSLTPASMSPGRTERDRSAPCSPRRWSGTACASGMYTSPHLVRVEERIRVGGKIIPAAAFRRLAGEIKERSEKLLAGKARGPADVLRGPDRDRDAVFPGEKVDIADLRGRDGRPVRRDERRHAARLGHHQHRPRTIRNTWGRRSARSPSKRPGSSSPACPSLRGRRARRRLKSSGAGEGRRRVSHSGARRRR